VCLLLIGLANHLLHVRDTTKVSSIMAHSVGQELVLTVCIFDSSLVHCSFGWHQQGLWKACVWGSWSMLHVDQHICL